MLLETVSVETWHLLKHRLTLGDMGCLCCIETTEPKNIGTKMPDDKNHLRTQQMCWKKKKLNQYLCTPRIY